MKTRNAILATLVFSMFAVSGCATLDNAAVEQEEIVTQIQKEQAASQVPESAGRWLDANGWEFEAMGDGDAD